MSGGSSQSTKRKPEILISCSNCHRLIPRNPNPNFCIITNSVTFTKPGTSERLTLTVGDAINYLFKPKLPKFAFENLSFCSTCNPLFKTLLAVYAAIRTETSPESIFFRFLQGDQGEAPAEVQSRVSKKVPKVKLKKKVDELGERSEDENDGQTGDVDWTGPEECLSDNEKFRDLVRAWRKRKSGRVSRRVKNKKCKVPEKEYRVPPENVSKEDEQAESSHGEIIDFDKEPLKKKTLMTAKDVEREFYTDDQGDVLVRCTKCSDTFGGVEAWAQHQLQVHETHVGWGGRTNGAASEAEPTKDVLKGKNRFLPCPDLDCGRILYARLLAGHVYHFHKLNSLYTCSHCHKGFSSKDGRDDHELRIHVMKNYHPFLCRICGQSYAKRGNLLRHELAHSGELPKPFQCDQCPSAFTKKSLLRKHEASHVPLADRPKPFTCPHCSSTWFSKRSLIQHLYVHTQERDRYKCQFEPCQKAYPRKAGMLVHLMNTHGVEESTARTSLNMRLPMKVFKDGEEVRRPPKPQLICSICSKTFRRKTYYAVHVVSVHGKTEEEAKAITGLVTKSKFPYYTTKQVRRNKPKASVTKAVEAVLEDTDEEDQDENLESEENQDEYLETEEDQDEYLETEEDQDEYLETEEDIPIVEPVLKLQGSVDAYGNLTFEYL